jgi:nitrogenase molybdenum-iron protein alpha/beta subunit
MIPLADVTAEPDYSHRVGPTYLVGVYLAVNAIRDAFLLVEGPDCAHVKTQFVQGNHDWLSTLTSVSGLHRVANTALHPDMMSASREHALAAKMAQVVAHPEVPGLILTSMAMASITGADYGRLAREAARASGKPVVHVPGKSLSGDWLDGYAETLKALAMQLDLKGGEPQADKVGIVGILFDRNEGDQVGNVRELERTVAALGLQVVSVWPAGQRFGDLAAIRDAGTIISLPYARRAAREVVRQTGARLIELPLPFGLPATEAWVRELGLALGRAREAEAFITAELSQVVPALEWVIPFIFQNRHMGYIGDPHLLPGLHSFLDTLGADLGFAILPNRAVHTRELPESLKHMDLLVYPKNKTMTRFLAGHMAGGDLDLLVAANGGALRSAAPLLEFGFPSPTRHSLYPRPFLGFGGALALADTMANTMCQHAIIRGSADAMRRGTLSPANKPGAQTVP